jgi:hypothetical protein
VKAGLCFCHAHPEKLAELGRQGGQKNRRWKLDEGDLPHRPLKSIGEVSELLEETINRVRQGPFDLRAANAIGFLAGILLKALDQRVEERLAHLEAVMSGRTRLEPTLGLEGKKPNEVQISADANASSSNWKGGAARKGENKIFAWLHLLSG